MPAELVAVDHPRIGRDFLRFPYDHYRGDPHWVPPLRATERAQFDPDKNPAYDFCQVRRWIVREGRRTVGRVAAIHNRRLDGRVGKKVLRLGWLEFVDDAEVLDLLIDAVEGWGRELGAEQIEGPMGFTSFDPMGVVVEGFDRGATAASAYNYPYYGVHLERRGFEKGADYVEFRAPVSEGLPERIDRIADVVMRRRKLRRKPVGDTKAIVARAAEVFALINQTYSELFDYVELSPGQIELYTKRYLSFLHPDYTLFIENGDGELVGFLIAMPSLSDGLRRARGRLLPFGWRHLRKAWEGHDTIDCYLVAVRPDYQGSGLFAVLQRDLFNAAVAHGVRWCESNGEWEENSRIVATWQDYGGELYKRKRIYKRSL